MAKTTFMGQEWTEKHSDDLQKVVDGIFGNDEGKLKGLIFSFTIADPNLEDCPLVGCSTGFGALCGYQMHEIVGRNCRFLVDPVPPELIEDGVRRMARDFCVAVRENREYKLPDTEKEEWMLDTRPSDDGVFCIQTNARKDGTLFKNLFHLKRIELNERPYIIGLQTEVPGELWERGPPTEVCRHACRLIDQNMAATERAMASLFWYSAPMRRQEDPDELDGFTMMAD